MKATNINDYILSGEYIMATIKDVASKAGVSICTVSRALAGKDLIKPETREAILQAAKELNYKPNYVARSLKKGKTNTFGLILPDITNPYYPKLAKYIESSTAKRGYMVLLCNSDNQVKKEKQFVEMLKARNVDGVLVAPVSGEIKHIQKLQEWGIPYVILNRNYPEELCSVSSDNYYGAFTMTEYLIGKGHRRIGGLFQSFHISIYEERYHGMCDALKEHGIPVDEQLMVTDINDISCGYQKIQALLRMEDRLTAIFSSNDMLAINVYRAAYELGIKIPEKLSVTGYDDIPLAMMLNPPLTTYLQPEDAMSESAVEYLISMIEGGQPYSHEQLRGYLVERKSAAEV